MLKRQFVNVGLVAFVLFWLVTFSQAAQVDWKKDWDQTLAAAKKEGQVTVYIYRYEGLLQDFKRDYPGINVVAVTGRGNDLTNRIMAERRGGKFIADVYSGGTNSLYNTLYKGKALDPLAPLMVLPEVTDRSKWYNNEHRYADPEGKYIFAFIGSPSNAQLAYNANLVNPKDFKSYTDVLNPKWKGKIVSLDPRDTGLGATMQFWYYSPEIGPEYMKKFFGGMEVTYAKNFQQMTNWLAQGKYAICMGCKDSARAKKQGLPVDDFDTNYWKEGSSFSAGGGLVAHMKAGRVKLLAVTGAKRSAITPDIPTIAESGVPGYDVTGWYGLSAPAKTPRAIVDRVNTAVNRALPELRDRYFAIGTDLAGGTPDEFAAFIRSEFDKWARVAKLSGAKVE